MRLAVRSVLDQDTTGWRLVIVDDCYPDEATSDWLASLQGPDVVYVRNEETLGVNGNFRRALSLATAEHVVFMGCDDLLEPGYVAAVQTHPGGAPGRSDRVPRCAGHRRRRARGRNHWSTASRDTFAPARGPDRPCRRGRARLPDVRELDLLPQPLLEARRHHRHRLPTRVRRGPGPRPARRRTRRGRGAGRDPGPALPVPPTRGSESATKTVVGARFEEERRYFGAIATELDRSGLRRAARAARGHVTSRLHAAALLPVAARNRDGAAVARLLRHATR